MGNRWEESVFGVLVWQSEAFPVVKGEEGKMAPRRAMQARQLLGLTWARRERYLRLLSQRGGSWPGALYSQVPIIMAGSTYHPLEIL